MRKPTPLKIARAICEEHPQAGQEHEAPEGQTAAVRARNLVQQGYVVKGDPYGWGRGRAIATVILEPQGHRGDCQPPPSMMFVGGEGWYIEDCNPAVALVWL